AAEHVADLAPPAVEDIVIEANGGYRVTGPAPKLVFETPTIRGDEAGLLSLRFDCARKEARLRVGWRASFEHGDEEAPPVTALTGFGRVAIPLDASPRWLLAKRIHSISLGILPAPGCRRFRIRDPALWQRRGARPVLEGRVTPEAPMLSWPDASQP
ncbi:MAG: hypothetical protein AAGF23_27475, partial [Acidobacteriota bacterium]